MDTTENVTDTKTNYNHSVPDTTGSATPFFDTHTTWLLNTTEGSNLGHGSSSTPSFNIVFIPAFVGLILVIVFCIRCCKWFRRYSSGDKSDKAYYAVVDPEDDLAIEMSPDSAYDSYCSASRRQHDEERNSLQAVRRVLIHDPAAAGPSGAVADRNKSEQNGEPIEETIAPLIENESKKNNNNRKTSSSSSQTTTTTCSESEPGNSSDVFKKPARFRVSFVAEVTNENEVHFSKLNKRNMDTGRTSLNSSLRMRNGDAQRVYAECVHCIERRTSVLLKNVGTQTNKSFIYSMKFSKQYRSGGKSGVDSNGVGDSSVYKAKKSESQNNLYDVNTQTTSENNNKLVKMCNGGICEANGKELSVVHVSCSKTATMNDQQNGQVHLEMTSHS